MHSEQGDISSRKTPISITDVATIGQSDTNQKKAQSKVPDKGREKKSETEVKATVEKFKGQLRKVSQQEKQFSTPISKNMAASIFDLNSKQSRQAPELPSIEGIEYPRAASWANESLANVLKDEKGRQLFHVFLHDALAEENLSFIESYEKFKQMTTPADKKQYIQEFFEKYSPYVNLSSVALQKIKETAATDNPDPAAFLLAVKEVGRYYFRYFLRNIHAEENLRFWEAVIEFKQTKNKSTAMLNMGRNIQKQYLVEGTTNEIFLPFGLRQVIDNRIETKEVDNTLFDEAVKHVEHVLKNDPYIRFLQSTEYNDLLAKLK
uniref:RGS domain-containing protein n=1 Tax=Setaria digitata TaxID=48799 RepID=A0A915PPN2_9BILA